MTRWVLALLLAAALAGCAETKAPPSAPAPTAKLPPEVEGGPESALPKHLAPKDRR